ncbi:hypothetical protein [Phenylobacterium sp.]|uniref:hypothetical protein n=1 Tax=Phenylobacterium sp. TaxID=1871053 RepID=UPI0035B26F3F
MKSGLVVLSLAAALLVACERRPAPPPAAVGTPAQTVERPSAIRWDQAGGVFEAGGVPLRTARLWTFDGSTDGFTGAGSQVTPADPQGLAVSLSDPTLRSPRGLQAPGGQFPLVLVRLTRLGQGRAWDGALYYATTTHGEGAGWLTLPLDNTPPKVGETVTLVYDMSRQRRGAPDWMQAMIEQIRLDLEAGPGARFVVHQVAIAAPPPGLVLPGAPGPIAVQAATPPTPMQPLAADLAGQLAVAAPAGGCNVEEASLAASGEGDGLGLTGWISELGAFNTSPTGFARLQGPGGDFGAEIRVDKARPDVARHFNGGDTLAASGFSQAFTLPPLPPGVYTPWVYRRTPGGWIACKGAQALTSR